MSGRVKILVTGASGLLGHRLVQRALAHGHQVCSAYSQHPPSAGTPARLDITDGGAVAGLFERLRPDVVVHAAAITDVDLCEEDKALAMRVNGEGTRNVAQASAEAEAFLAYISTDFVFDGERGMYGEGDVPNPVNHYGYTKLLGERHVRECVERWLIARTGVVYGWGRGHRPNFATWLLDGMRSGREVRVVADQYATPTLNTSLAEMLLEAVEGGITGMLHLVGGTRLSRYQFAQAIARRFQLPGGLIRPVESSEVPRKARRPKDSSLLVSRAEGLLSCKPLGLNTALERFYCEEALLHAAPSREFK